MPVRGPRLKIVRRLGVELPGLTRKVAEDSRAVASANSQSRRPRRKPSELRLRLEEKQKVRFNYGVTERQMVRYLESARHMPGRTGENLLALLERRLDNVVFRLGFAATIPAARQLVSHGHVRVNGVRVDRASYLVQVGEVVDLTPRARASRRELSEPAPVLRLPSHLRRDPGDAYAGRVIANPTRSDVPFPVREALIVEFYAR